MEYQKRINLRDDTTNQSSKLEQEIGLKQLMNQKEDMIIVRLDLKRQWQDQIYVIILIHTYLLKELLQFQTRKLQA